MSKSFYWRHPLCLAPRNLRAWLANRDSLTARLHAHFQGIKVVVCQQGWQKAHNDELQSLQIIRSKNVVACREVLLTNGHMPLIFAHSITLRASLRRGFHLFDRAGSRPLGALLFADPTIRRSPLAWRRIDRRHPLWQKAHAACGTLPAQLWARRSLFRSGRDLLLVSEVFLPAITSKP